MTFAAAPCRDWPQQTRRTGERPSPTASPRPWPGMAWRPDSGWPDSKDWPEEEAWPPQDEAV